MMTTYETCSPVFGGSQLNLSCRKSVQEHLVQSDAGSARLQAAQHSTHCSVQDLQLRCWLPGTAAQHKRSRRFCRAQHIGAMAVFKCIPWRVVLPPLHFHGGGLPKAGTCN